MKRSIRPQYLVEPQYVEGYVEGEVDRVMALVTQADRQIKGCPVILKSGGRESQNSLVKIIFLGLPFESLYRRVNFRYHDFSNLLNHLIAKINQSYTVARVLTGYYLPVWPSRAYSVSPENHPAVSGSDLPTYLLGQKGYYLLYYVRRM